MANNNRELSQFANRVTVDDSTKVVSMASTMQFTGGSAIGIGTNPGNLLAIYGDAPRIDAASSNGESGLRFNVEGSASYAAYRFQYLGDTKVTILNNGLIGVGVATPTASIDADGNVFLRAGGFATYATRLSSSLNATHASSLESFQNSGTPYELIGAYASSGGSSPRTVLSSGGEPVGIATIAPQGDLNLHGGSADDSQFYITTPTKTKTRLGYIGLSNRFGIDYDGLGFQIRDANNSYENVFMIDDSGDIRLGTNESDPCTKLSQNGTVTHYLGGTGASGNVGTFIYDASDNLDFGLYTVGDGYMWRSFDTSMKLIGRVGTTGGVQLTNGGTSWSAYVSESRLKDIVGECDYDQSWNLVRDIELKRYYYKDQEDKTGVSYLGPMADWLEKQDPELVIYNQPDEDGPVRTFNQGLLDMKALAALSAALKRIEALEAEVAALKG